MSAGDFTFPSSREDMQAHGSSFLLVLSALAALAFGIRLVYRLALPRPIPGIPYNAASVRKILGDVPAMRAHIWNEDGTFITYIMESLRKLNAPLIQVFIRPLSSPLLILADFREAHDLLVHRKDFDRSPSLGDLVKGLTPDHHIHLPTNAAWKMQRRLVQDLMTPSFLHKVAAPAIHQHALLMMDLWRAKSRIAHGRPWAANDDINHVALDAVMAFAFGEDFQHSMTRPNLDAVKALDSQAIEKLTGGRGGLASKKDEPVNFPLGQVDEFIQATLDLTETVGEVQGNPMPTLTWKWVNSRPKIRRATKIKEDCIARELAGAVQRLQDGAEVRVKSAVDHLVLREKELAAKDGRSPSYFSRVMKDEIFGFLFAGHETTSTTACWALKFLADTPTAQNTLHARLQTAFPSAKSQSRNVTVQEILGSHMPYLDATIEEVLRCAGTAPVVDRQALVDTEILGHRVPKGTIVTCLVTGASMMSPAFAVEEGLRSPTSQTAKKAGRDRAWDGPPEDMSVFRPERWLDAETGEFDATAGPQLAFGLGTRGCYGKRLVYVEMRILLALIVWNFELLSCPGELSGYKSVLITTNEPRQCFVRLREVR